MHNQGRLLLAAFFASVFAFGLCAQEPREPSPRQQRQSPIEIQKDTLVVKAATYITARNAYLRQKIEKDTLDQFYHQYDRARRTNATYAHLGNLGSAHRALLFQMPHSKGLDFGQHQFDLYRLEYEDFKFYDAPTSLTRFYYSQGLDQMDGVLNAQFARNFSDGVKLSLEYRRINQEGQYASQAVKNTAFGIGAWYTSPNGRYDGLYLYRSNSILQEENGGLVNFAAIDTLIQDNNLPGAFPINLGGALTTHRQRVLSVENHFHLTREHDTLRRKAFADIIHTGHYGTRFIKFFDEGIENNAEYYSPFGVDDRGMRHFVFARTVDNHFDIQFRYKRDDDRQHFLRAGIQYRRIDLEQEPQTRKINEVFLNGSGRFVITPDIHLNARAYIGLGDQSGDFSIDGAAVLSLQKAGTITGRALIYHRGPTLIENTLFVSMLPVWNNNFSNITHSRLGLKYQVPDFRLTVRGAAHLITNYIYIDPNRQPVQINGNVNILQIVGSKELQVGKLGMAGTIALQSSDDILRLPSVIGTLQIYYADLWFNNALSVRTGVDLRITDGYPGVGYFPLTGQFYHDDRRDISQYPALDFFFDMQVKTGFRAFVKLENLSSYFIRDNYEQILDYPIFEAYFRFGLWMKLFE